MLVTQRTYVSNCDLNRDLDQCLLGLSDKPLNNMLVNISVVFKVRTQLNFLMTFFKYKAKNEVIYNLTLEITSVVILMLSLSFFLWVETHFKNKNEFRLHIVSELLYLLSLIFMDILFNLISNGYLVICTLWLFHCYFCVVSVLQ